MSNFYSDNKAYQYLTLEDCTQILSDNTLIAGYKNREGRYEAITNPGLNVFTKKSSITKNEVIGRADADLLLKIHHKHAELYIRHDQFSCQNIKWHGIEPGHLNGNPVFFEVLKRAVINDSGEIIGSLFCSKIISNTYSNSLTEILDFLNPTKNTNITGNIEFLQSTSTVGLTNREMDCLYYTLRGKSAKAIAPILNISSKTIEFHLEKIKMKFNCRTKMELIDNAIEKGFLNKITPSIIMSHVNS